MVIIVKITATFHTDELRVSKAVGKCNASFHILHIVNIADMWVSVPPNLGSLEGIFGNRENLTIRW